MKKRMGYLWLAVRQHCKNEANFILNRRQRIFYTLKALWAIFWNREGMINPADVIEVAIMGFYRTYSLDYGEGAVWSMIQVPYGLRGWTFDIGWTGCP